MENRKSMLRKKITQQINVSYKEGPNEHCRIKNTTIEIKRVSKWVQWKKEEDRK